MKYAYPQIVLQEVPGEISLAISISGCPLRCSGCHSKETYDANFGNELTVEILDKLINRHISCVLFYGGEWEKEKLIEFLKYIQFEKGIKTCLYTGLNLCEVETEILDNLDYIKTGRYIKTLGGIGEKNTNQRFYILEKGK